MKKRVAFIVDTLDNVFPEGPLKGGGNLVAQKLILEFSKKEDIELHIFSGQAKDINIDGVQKINILESSPYIYNHLFLYQIKTLTENNFDYVMFINMLAPFENVLVQAFSSVYRYKNTKNPLLKFILMYLYGQKQIKYSKSRFTKENKNFFVVSEMLKKDCIENMEVDADKITVVYPGVEIKNSEKTKNDIFTFGIASGTSLNKGILDVILSAFLMKLTRKNFRIKAILSIPQKNKVIEFLIWLLRLNKYFEIMPRQKDMSKFYTSVDCVLMPSLNETFGLIPLEAAAFKTPSIMSSTIGVTEIFTDNLNTLIFEKRIFPVFNLYKKMCKMLNLYSDKEAFSKLQNNAYEVAKKYTWESFADKIYEKISEEISK